MKRTIIPIISATAISVAALSGAAWAQDSKTKDMGQTGVEAEAGKTDGAAKTGVTTGATSETTSKDMVPGAKNEERETLPDNSQAKTRGGTAVEGNTAVTAESEADKIRGGESESGDESSRRIQTEGRMNAEGKMNAEGGAKLEAAGKDEVPGARSQARETEPGSGKDNAMKAEGGTTANTENTVSEESKANDVPGGKGMKGEMAPTGEEAAKDKMSPGAEDKTKLDTKS